MASMALVRIKEGAYISKKREEMVYPDFERSFHDFIHHLQKWIPEGVIEVNLPTLKRLGLLPKQASLKTVTENFSMEEDVSFPFHFHTVETKDKVTLFNEQFVIWIVPKWMQGVKKTLTLVSLLHEGRPHLELVFSNRGIYNTPRCVLNVLHHFLLEVIDNEIALASIRS